jgi:putative ABC transport system substrate-binding protein
MRKAGVLSMLVAVILLAAAVIAEAQQPEKVRRIAHVLASLPSAVPTRTKAFREGLRELGYVEGKNIVVEWRSVEGKLENLPILLADIVRLKVDVIVSGGPESTRAAKEATATIPIVMAQDTDPVANGFVSSLARPGGNITGLSNLAPDLSGKRLELLKETLPKLSRVAVLGTSTGPGNARALNEIEIAAVAYGVIVQYLDVLSPNYIDTAFGDAIKGRADAILTLPSPVLNSNRAQIAQLAAKNRLAALYHNSLYVEDGGLMFYGVNVADLDRRAATYVDKILKGAKPAELAVEQPKKFEFVINLKTAKQIGLTIPPNVLARADRVIR